MKYPSKTASNAMLVGLFLACQGTLAADIEVMTQNQYLGADLTPVITATTPDQFNTAVINALKQIAANNTPARIKAQAALIDERKPDLVGLQEVSAFECFDPDLTGACTDGAIVGAFNDHLALTLAALNGAYATAAVVENLKVSIPFSLYEGSSKPAYLTVLDRDVILKRTDVESEPVNYPTYICTKPSGDGCNYQAVLGPIVTPAGSIYVERGYVGVDAMVGGRKYRFVNTHLEVKDPDIPPELQIQTKQAQELISVLSQTTPLERSLVVVGDMNSSPVDPGESPYSQYVSSGFTDSWTLRPGKATGFTCCQLEDLSNHKSILYERIDLILTMERPEKIKQARVLGNTVSTKTPPPGKRLWPSDHGAVAAGIEYY